MQKQTTDKIDIVIDDLILELRQYPGYDEDYSKRVEQLERLYKIKESNAPDRVSPDTLAIVLGNIGIALMLIGFEQKHVITTRVLPFLSRLR